MDPFRFFDFQRFAARMRRLKCALELAGLLVTASLVYAQPAPNRIVSAAPTIVKPPSGVLNVYIIGDSTAAKSNSPDTEGWGTPFLSYFDPAKIRVVNAATDSGSTRTSLNEAAAEEFVAQLRLDDIVLIQLGHNDTDDVKDSAGRGSLPGFGDETEQVTRAGKTEFVHSFGWYMRDAIGRIRAAAQFRSFSPRPFATVGTPEARLIAPHRRMSIRSVLPNRSTRLCSMCTP